MTEHTDEQKEICKKVVQSWIDKPEILEDLCQRLENETPEDWFPDGKEETSSE